jgi:serine/threonine protein kinase
LIGVGGFGEVWKAINPELPHQPPVALKFSTNPADKEDLDNAKTLLARILANGKQPGIVELINTYLRADPPCLEYEYVAGGELTGLIREYHSRGGLTPKDSAKIVHRLAKTVGYFHRLDPPIVHRDLKPANILVHTSAPGKITLKIADFGIGGIASKGEIERSQTQMSGHGKLHTIAKGAYTPLYASPEQIRGDDPDPRDDVHALGIIWYQLLTGDQSRGAPAGIGWMANLRARKMTQEQIDLIASCFDSDKRERPVDAGVLAEAILRIFDLGPPPPPTTEVLYINSKMAKASGYTTPEGFVVLKGSEARVESAPKIPSSAVGLRKKLLETGVLSIKDQKHYEFTKDHAFRTSSSAASVILACSVAGPANWKDKNGIQLKDILKDKKIP